MRTRPALSSVAVLASLALCAAANRAATAAAEQAPAAGREGGLTLTTRSPAGQRGRWFVEFQAEIRREAGSGGSLRGAADVDCGASQFRVVKYRVFEGPKFTGALLLDLSQRSDWRTPEPGTTMDRVLIAACGRSRSQAKVLQASGRAAGGGPARPGPSDLAPAAQPSTTSTILTRAAVAEPAAPAVALSPARSAAHSAGGGGFYAQLAAMPSEAAARQTWDALKRAAPGVLDDRLRRLTPATVHGRRVYRVLAGGFGARAQAETVCKALAGLSAQCFVRPGDAT